MLIAGQNVPSAALPWLSILIPFHNVAPFIGECLHSILKQINGDAIEILLVDDCSNDGSRDIVEAIAAQHPGIIQILSNANNSGPSVSRNVLLDHAKGRYLWCVDSDDYILPGAIKGLRAIIDKHAPQMVICDFRKRGFLPRKGFPGRGGRLQDNTSDLLAGIFKSRKLYVWNKIIARSVWDETLRFPIGKTFEDIALLPHILLKVNSYFYARRPWVNYRVRPGSIMTSVTRTAKYFDTHKHDDMADAFAGFSSNLRQTVDPHSDAGFQMANFIAREYCGLVGRYRDAGGDKNSAVLLAYQHRFESGSPIAFAALLQAYLRRGKMRSYFRLRAAMAHGKSEQA
jgi:glycosyltransferase involved in cell wall biosynthesis